MESLQKLLTAGLVHIKDNRLLLTFSKNKKAWYLPGGKIDFGENSLQALIREIKEELNVDLNPNDLKFYMHIEAIAYGEKEKVLMQQDCYRVDKMGKLLPQAEIEAFSFMNYNEYLLQENQVEGVLILFQKLISDGLLNSQN